MDEFFIYMAIGFIAQLIDGALGMAYGLTTTSFLLSIGLPPATASAVTHAAECVTTGFSAISHHRFGNVDRALFIRLLIPGIIGSIGGVFVLTHIDSDVIKPFVGLYLFGMGLIVLSKAFMVFPPQQVGTHLIPLGLTGGFMDAVGGGGWGPIVTSTLLARGNSPRLTIGSVNAVEFFIASASSIAFFLSSVVVGWKVIAALALGGALAAPLGAVLCRHIPVKMMLFIVGILILGLAFHILWMVFH